MTMQETIYSLWCVVIEMSLERLFLCNIFHCRLSDFLLTISRFACKTDKKNESIYIPKPDEEFMSKMWEWLLIMCSKFSEWCIHRFQCVNMYILFCDKDEGFIDTDHVLYLLWIMQRQITKNMYSIYSLWNNYCANNIHVSNNLNIN